MLDKLLSKIRDHFSKYPCFQKGGCFSQEVDADTILPVKLPFFKMIFIPFNLLLDNVKTFFILSLPVALLITVTAMSLGYGYMCVYEKVAPITAYCSNSGIIYFLYNFIKIFFWAFFAIKWCESVFLQKQLSWQSIFSFDKRILKLELFFILFILLNFLPMVSGWILYLRVPNPDWRVEILFFAVVSIGFIIPFILLRFYSLIPFVIYGRRLPPLKEVWYKTSGNMFTVLLSLFVIFILTVVFLGNLYSNFQKVAANSGLYINFSSEFIYSLLVLIILALVINNFCIQQRILFEEKGEIENDGK